MYDPKDLVILSGTIDVLLTLNNNYCSEKEIINIYPPLN